MPHVDLPFDPTKPADGDLLSLGDDQIRKIVRQLIEAFTDLVVDVNADPLVLKSSAVGGTTIADGSITAAKLAAAIGLRSSLLTSTNITHSFNAEATWSLGVAYLPAVPGQIVLPFWVPANSTEAELLGRITLSGYVDTGSLITLVMVNTGGVTISVSSKQVNILLINPTPVGT